MNADPQFGEVKEVPEVPPHWSSERNAKPHIDSRVAAYMNLQREIIDILFAVTEKQYLSPKLKEAHKKMDKLREMER